MRKHYRILNNFGQTILELLIVISVLTIVIGAFTSLALNNLKDAQISRNRNNANRLAQELSEQVRNVREQQGWDEFAKYQYNAPGNRCFKSVNISTWELEPKNGGPIVFNGEPCSSIEAGVTPLSVDKVDYKRWIELEDSSLTVSPECPSGCQGRKVSVTITWNDSQGRHEEIRGTLLTERI